MLILTKVEYLSAVFRSGRGARAYNLIFVNVQARIDVYVTLKLMDEQQQHITSLTI
jgi:hypothetical protein